MTSTTKFLSNGLHEVIALEIEGKELVFDNIHPQGVSRVDWINNLYCPIKDTVPPATNLLFLGKD